MGKTNNALTNAIQAGLIRFISVLATSAALVGATVNRLSAQRTPIAAPSRGVKTLAFPPGPAPQNVRVRPGSPVLHVLEWDRLPGVAGYRVFKLIKDQWYALTQQVLMAETWSDAALVQPGTTYRVTAAYPDGRQGDTDFIYTNPPQPQVPTGFTVQPAGPGAVTLSWQPLQFASFRLFGSGQPATGTLINGTQTSLAKLPDGTHTWSLSADYGGVHGPGPSVSITLSSSGRYRVVANGFRVVNHTNDLTNVLTGDGEGDEVYGGFAMFHVARPSGLLLDQDLRQTLVHGDAGKVPNRVKAGTASLQGGLQNSDVFPPVLDPSQRYGQAPTSLTFPFLIWDGTLTNATDAVIVLPTLWESDPATALSLALAVTRTDPATSYTNWFLAEVAELPRVWADPMVQQALQSKAIALTTPPGWTYFPAVHPTARLDHPIGAIFDQVSPVVAGGAGKRLPRRAIVLTRESIEAALGGGSTGIVQVPLADQGAQGIVGNGHYILYVQVERVP